MEFPSFIEFDAPTPQFFETIGPSSIFKKFDCSNLYLEIFNNDNDKVNLIFRRPENIPYNKELDIKKVQNLKEIKFVFDFQCLTYDLPVDKAKELLNKFYNFYNQKENTNKAKFILAIQNTLINNFTSTVMPKKMDLHELIISDELYNISPNLDILFPKVSIHKLVLKKFKINSRLQLSNFTNFILQTDCEELILEDIFIELIIKKDKNDEEYNDLDCYFTYKNGIITLNNQYTTITSLKLRDCPLFALNSKMFTLNNKIPSRNIDIDENSLINPSIITNFKIIGNKFDICFDLDSYKLKKEEEDEEEENKNANNIKKKEDYLDYLSYIFNIIIGFSDENKNKLEKEKNGKGNEEEEEEEEEEAEEEEKENEDDEVNININNKECLYKLKFKNFDTTKYEYITNDQAKLIKEEDLILNNEEKKRKEKWENFEEKLKIFKFEKLSNVKKLIFDNCSNFFVQWILHFLGLEKEANKNNINSDLELLKLKKCGKDYIDLKNILNLKIDNLILFDTPLIIDHFNNQKKSHLYYFKDNLGYVDNLTIKINTLEYYNKEFNLNTYKTMEIITELIQCKNFNKNIIFEMNALSKIMTFLVYKNYFQKKSIYDSPNIEEKGEDKIIEEEINKIKATKDINNEKDEITFIPKQFFFCKKLYRDYLLNNSLKLNSIENSKITIKNTVIKKQSENYENLNYLLVKAKKEDKKSKELKKAIFGCNLIDIDKDYKLFFNLNNIKNITFQNVMFSHSINSAIKQEEGETIINLISYTEEEKNIIENNKYTPPKIPNFRMDMKTLNGILFKNFLFEDIGSMFRFFMLKVEPKKENIKKETSDDIAERKTQLMEYFIKYKKILDTIKDNIKKFIIIINDIKEIKELFCMLSIFKIISIKGNWFKEILLVNKVNKEIELPIKEKFEEEIGEYFMKDKNQEDKEVYSEFNYYFTSPEEEKMFKTKKIEINNYTFYIDCQLQDYRN